MSENILDLTGAGLDETFDPTTVPAGEEYELTIVNAIMGTDKNGVNFFMPFFEVDSDPYCKEFGDYLPLPNANVMSEKDLNKSRLRINSFTTAFNIEISDQMDLEEWKGMKGWAILGMGKDQENQPVNKINKYVVSA